MPPGKTSCVGLLACALWGKWGYFEVRPINGRGCLGSASASMPRGGRVGVFHSQENLPPALWPRIAICQMNWTKALPQNLAPGTPFGDTWTGEEGFRFCFSCFWPVIKGFWGRAV